MMWKLCHHCALQGHQCKWPKVSRCPTSAGKVVTGDVPGRIRARNALNWWWEGGNSHTNTNDRSCLSLFPAWRISWGSLDLLQLNGIGLRRHTGGQVAYAWLLLQSLQLGSIVVSQGIGMVHNFCRGLRQACPSKRPHTCSEGEGLSTLVFLPPRASLP